MKKKTKRCLACLLAVLMVLGNLGIYFPEGAPTAEASGDTNTNPAYMAKMVVTSDAKHSRTGQTIAVTAGKTYNISFNMCVVTQGRLQAWIGEDNCVVQGTEPVTGEPVLKTATYTVPTGKTSVYFNFQVASGEFYIWDVKFTEEGSDENLLTNADFSADEGSWIGWRFSDWGGASAQSVNDVTKSDELESASGRTVVAYNEDLFFQNVEKIPTGDPEYMAKLNGTYVDANSQTKQYTWVWQSIKPTVGKTYKFTCNYYVDSGSYTDAVLWSTKNGNGISQKMRTGNPGTMEITYKAVDGDTDVHVRFEAQPNTVCYIWNVCLSEENGKANLLQNGSLKKENGSWVGWKIGSSTIKDKAGSDTAIASYGQEVVAYDKTIIPQPEGIPSGDPEYMAKIQVKADANWAWIYQGIQAEKGTTYKFTCDYYFAEGNEASALIWSTANGQTTDTKSSKMKQGEQGKVDLTYQLPDGDDRLNIRFECAPGTTVYIWNVCLSEDNGEVNLLTNGSFSRKEGSWIGWKVVTDTTISDKAASDAVATTYGHEILPFNKDILPQPEVPEGIPSGDPTYMAKIQQKADAKNWLWIYQGIDTEQGKTYKFTCDYYVADGESGTAVVWSSKNGTNTDEKSAKLKADTQGKLEITYELPAGDDRLNVRFETAPGTVCYVWNVCLSEENGEYNLLKNGSFSKEEGSWIGWQIGQSAVIKDKTASLAATEQYGPEIIAFNKDILPKPEVLEGIPSGDPAYMAKIQQKADAKNWIWIYQGIQTEQGKTYKFTCDYYVADGESGKAVIWSSNNGKNTDEKWAQLKADTQGKIEITYKLPAGDDRLNVRFETAPGTVCYVWNVCLSEENGTVNLLKNGSFSKENGSWTGWQVGQSGVIKNKAASDAATETYGPAIIAFNKDILPKPEVPEGIPTGEPTYMARIQQKADAKNWLWIYQGIDTTQGKTYKFTCNYYVAQGESGKAVVWSSNNGKPQKKNQLN